MSGRWPKGRLFRAAAPGVGLVAVVAVGLMIHQRSQPEHGDGLAGGPARLRQAPGHPEPWSEAGNISEEQQHDSVMQMWREAILNQRSEDVLACDRIFRDNSRRFDAALRRSAKSDPEDRVRAFSTRVLGKFRDPALAELFRELLKDSHQYVRSNAAWGLGQLGGENNLAVLDQVRRSDREPYVREAASKALGAADRSARGD
jgi:hypothetical protein